MEASPGETGRNRLRPGDRIAGYEIENYLARGGMAVLYQARDLRLQRRVALKLIAPDLASDEHFRGRFIQESHLAASLDHPNIIPIFEAGESGEVLYLAMRYVEGMDLAKLFRGYDGPAPTEQLIDVLRQAAAALDAAHDAGLVHRDVKPANILVAAASPRDEGAHRHVYLTDFGLTKRTSSLSGFTTAGHFIGTIEYVAPEQVRGEPVGPPGDIYSLACVAYEGLTGRVPFPRDNNAAILWAHVAEPPTLVHELCPWLPESVDEVLSAGLSKNADDRPVTCSAFVRDLAAVLQVPATRRVQSPSFDDATWDREPPSPPPPAPATPRRRRRVWWAAAAAVIVLLAVLLPILLTSSKGEGSFRTYNATEIGAPVRLQYPAAWQEHPHQGFFLVLSPEPIEGLFAGDPWTLTASRAKANPAGVTGVLLHFHRPGFQISDLGQTKASLQDDLPSSSVRFTSAEKTTVDGRSSWQLDGIASDESGPTQLRIRAYVVPAGPTNQDTMSIVFFALPSRFDSQVADFNRVLQSVDLTPSA